MITKTYLKTVKQKELEALLEVSERRIQQLHAEGLPRNGSGRGVVYDWSLVRAWEKNRATGSGRSDSGLSDRQRRERAEADLAEMERDKAAGVLIVAEDARKVWGEQCANMRARLLSLPATAATRIEDGMTVAVREETLRSLVAEALAELSGVTEAVDA